MTTIDELRNMSFKELKEYRRNLIVGFPKDFNEFTVFVIDKVIEEKQTNKFTPKEDKR